MPARKTSLRRRSPAGSDALTPEQLEVLITGDLGHGAIIPTDPRRSGPPFENIEHARAAWKKHRAFVLRIVTDGWKPEDGRATMWVQSIKPGEYCWAEMAFGAA